MPRTMDTAHRHTLVSEAAWRVLVRDGPVALTVRKVADEAGLPPSSLRYTFPTQASVRQAAVSLLIERLSVRVDRAAGSGRGRESARAILLELLPLDAERAIEMEVTVSFLALALTDPSLRQADEQTRAAVRRVCEKALSYLDTPDYVVDLTHAVIDGLALHLLGQGEDRDTTWATKALDTHLALLESLTSAEHRLPHFQPYKYRPKYKDYKGGEDGQRQPIPGRLRQDSAPSGWP
jgi:AcrR family transcriptional regulator